MRKIPITSVTATFLASVVTTLAQTAPAAAPATPASADTPAGREGLKIEFPASPRAVTAYYRNDSQARLTLYPVMLYDGEIAKPRETFIVELRGFGIVEPLRLDADDTASISKVVALFERFRSESEKSGKLAASMKARKADADAALSREETRLVELKSADKPDAAAVAAVEKRIAELKAGVAMADEISAMPKISGVIGKAKLNRDRPEYEFIASFEPAKRIFTLSAGYSFRIASRDVTYYIDLLNHTQELKSRLLENEANEKRVRAEIDGIFAAKDE